MEEKKQYKFDAFISYRHCDLDKFVAENLHRILETYELPKDIKNKLGITGRSIKRVFRDQEELPLTSNLEDPIIDALENSKYLIVICSPRLKDSLWCKKEIETFKKLRGRKNIFCVLIEGEPKDSFPEEVLTDTIEVEKNGKKVKEEILVEPLAADVRGNNKKEVLKKIKEEKLRLIAPMYNLDYDDLRQRHKLRQQKKMMNTAIGIAIGCILFTIYSLAMFIKINMQQNVLSKYHALSLVDKSANNLNKDNRYNAIKLSYQALTDFDSIKMPYTSEAEYQLSESLGLYDVGVTYKAVANLKTKGIASYLNVSTNNKYGAVYDGSEHLTLFSTKDLKKVKEYSVKPYDDENNFTFVGDDILAYINTEGNIVLVNTKDGKKIKEIKGDTYYQAVKGDNKGRYLAYVERKTLNIYDTKTNENIGKIKLDDKNKYLDEIYFSHNDDYVFVSTEEDQGFNIDINKKNEITIHTIKVDEVKEINSVKLDAGYISGIITKDNNAYMLLNNLKDAKYTMLIVSYNYINGNTNYIKNGGDRWGKFINKSYVNNNIAITSYDVVNVLNASNGEVIESFNEGSEVIGVYSFIKDDVYLVFNYDGSVSYINMNSKKNIEYGDKYEFNIGKYTDIEIAEDGCILVPENDNRIVLYENKINKDAKKIDPKLDYIKDDSIKMADYETVEKEYNIKNKNLVEKIFYDTKKDVLFVNYKNKDIVIYNTKDKKKIITLENVGKVNHYFGKDKYGRTYIGDTSDSYILDKNYKLVGHINKLQKLEKDKVIVGKKDNYYSIKIYTLDDMKKIAKDYLKENK